MLVDEGVGTSPSAPACSSLIELPADFHSFSMFETVSRGSKEVEAAASLSVPYAPAPPGDAL